MDEHKEKGALQIPDEQQKLEDESSSKNTQTTRKIWKNVLVLSISFLICYISYTGMASIQSSLHRDEGMGTISTSSRYAAFTISSLFLATTVIRLCGHKWTITISFGSFLFWNVANGFGVWETMVPASIISGLFTAPLWTAQGAYLCEMAKQYAFLTNQEIERVTTLFFGVFGGIFLFSRIFGDIMTSTVLMQTPIENLTEPSTDDIEAYCGMNDCPWESFNNNTYFEKPPESLVWTLVGIYTALIIVAIIIAAVFLDQLNTMMVKQQQLTEKKKIKDEICSSVLEALFLMKDYRTWLLVPLNWLSSTMGSFWGAEYNGSWITCSIGIWMVGVIALPKSVLTSPIAYLTGYTSNKHGYALPTSVAMVDSIVVLVGLIFWTINPDDLWVYFLFSIGFGVSDGILDVVVQGLYGSTFPDNMAASFAVYNFFWCIIASITYGYSYYVCSDVKLYIVMGCWCLAVVCFAVLEVDKRQKDSWYTHEKYLEVDSDSKKNTKDIKLTKIELHEIG